MNLIPIISAHILHFTSSLVIRKDQRFNTKHQLMFWVLHTMRGEIQQFNKYSCFTDEQPGLRIPCLQWNSWWERLVQSTSPRFYHGHLQCTALCWAPCKCFHKHHLVQNLQHPRDVAITLTLVCRCVDWGSDIISSVFRSQGLSPVRIPTHIFSCQRHFTMLRCFQWVNEVLCGETQRSAELTEACQDLLGKSICSLTPDARRG